MPFPCPHCATPQEDNNTSCDHCGLTFGPGTDRPGAVASDADGVPSAQVTNFKELLAAVAARGSEVEPRAIPPPAPVIDMSKPDPNEYPQNGQAYPQPGQQYPGQVYPQPGQYYPQPQQPFVHPGQFNTTLYPNGIPQGINITQYPYGMNTTLMPVAVPVRQGLSVWATLLLAAIFGTLIAICVFLYLHVNVASGPTVKISQPANGTIIPAGSTVDISVEAKENMGHLTHVDFYYETGNSGRQFIQTSINPPYSCSWSTTRPGDYFIDAIATDDHGATSTAQTTIHVNGEPAPAQPVITPLQAPTPIAVVKPPVKPAVVVTPVKAPPAPVKTVAATPNIDAIRRAREARAVRAADYRREHPTPPAAPKVVAKPKPAPVVHHAGGKQYHITTLVSPSRANADILAAALRKRGYDVHTQRVGGGWAVQTPAYHSKSEADSAAKTFLKSGYNAGVGQ